LRYRTRRLRNEIRRYYYVRKKASELYDEYLKAPPKRRERMSQDLALFVHMPPDRQGRIRVIYMPRFMREFFLHSSMAFKRKMVKDQNPLYSEFIEIMTIMGVK
jgi:hypothetical protein